MRASDTLREIEGRSAGYRLLLAAFGVAIGAGLAAAWQMHEHGHVVTGMDNQVVWGMPHVVAVFLIVAASGALNAASIASVFGREFYKPLAPLSGLTAIALLAGGLAVLGLDLGRSDRLVVAMTHYNFKSIFAWNMFLYSGFFALVAAYLWAMLRRAPDDFSSPIGVAVFIWRLVLTTGTGSIFGFLVAREAYDSALLAPLFIVLSFAYGTAIYTLVLLAACRGTDRMLGDEVLARLGGLLAIFVAAALYFVAVFHLTNLYIARNHGIERFILAGSEIYTPLFWIGQVALGGVLPLALLLVPALKRARFSLPLACAAVVAGGIAQMYVTIIGAQAWPIDLFPGMQAKSSFFDGEIHPYAPGALELLLALGGVAIAGAIVAVGLKLLRVLPVRAG